YAGKPYLYVFTVRALTYINLYFIVSSMVDKSTILDLLGEKGVPVVIALSYYPYFYSLSAEVAFYARSRGIRFNVLKLSRPILVEMVKVAENLYVAYTVKLFGKYSWQRKLKPNISDSILIVLGVLIICLSLLLKFPLVG
ncbi:hypothetical protein, partial [Acidianus sp. RZ1]|uniref:hypothetical protein n=1 Tax=Acidianus sp. RZ1 TaxID=1540082 RepID=UPI0014909B71